MKTFVQKKYVPLKAVTYEVTSQYPTKEYYMLSKTKINIAGMFLISLLVLGISNLRANEKEIKIGRTGGYYFGFGTALISTDKMESTLLSSGFKKPDNWAYLYSTGFYGKRRLVFELEFTMLRWKPVEMGVNKTTLNIFTSFLNFGVNVLPLDLPMTLYPYIGSGFGKSKISLNQTSVDFSSAVTVPPIGIQASQNNFSFVTGIGYDFNFKSRRVPKKIFTTGIQLGYMFDVTDDNNWEYEEVEITHGPKLKATGFYAKVIVSRNFKKQRINMNDSNQI